MLQLRDMHATEYDRYRTLSLREYLDDLRTNFGYCASTAEEECERSLPTSLAEVMDEPGNALLVIERNGAGIGYAWLQQEGRTGHLLDLMIAPEHRQHGYGRLALGLIEARLQASGSESMQLRVAADNLRARRMYETSGLRVTGLLMAKPLRSRTWQGS